MRYELAKIISREAYMGSKLTKLLRLIRFMLEHQLQTHIGRALTSYHFT